MRRTTLVSTLVAFALALSPLPAAAHSVVYQATLLGSNESPPSGSLGTGTATVTVDFDLLTMHVQASFSDLGGNSTIAHIHCCLVSGGAPNVGVATPTPTFPGFPAGVGVTAGTYDQTFDLTAAASYNPAFVTAQGSLANAMNALLIGFDAGTTYFNIHTSTFPAGEIRGNLYAVPEPQTLALVGLALAFVAARGRRA